MHVRRLAASGLLLATCALVAGAASPALAVCDAYSTTCPTGAPTTPPNGGGGGGGEIDVPEDNKPNFTGGGGDAGGGGGTPTDGRTLPFTGGELVLLTSIGGAALAGGTALVLAGRRKTSPST